MSQRAAAIQSIAVLLNHRQKQQEEQQKHKQTTNYWKEEEQYIKKYNYYDNSNEPKKSILKGKNFEICEKEVGNDLNIINYSRKSVGEHQRQFSDEKHFLPKKELRWKGSNTLTTTTNQQNNKKELTTKIAKVDENNNNSEETFCCCSVCGGRIWSGDEKSAIFGKEELLVHCACFQCATCGMDLVDTPEEQVFKRDGRFYCQVHGPLAIIKNNKQQNNFIKKEENFSKNNFSKNILPSKEKFEEQQEWWERSADEFNGSKKSSTIVRFYGEERDKQQTNKNENNGGMFWKSTTTTTSKTTDKQQQTNNYLNKIETKENSNKYLNKNLINSACQVGKYKREEFNKNKFFGQKSNNNNNNNNDIIDDQKLCFCGYCNVELNGSFVLAKGRAWCPEHFCCANSACAKPLMESGFVEDPESRRNYCPKCYEVLLAPICFKCSLPLNESCINALGQKWHPECFFCTHCRKPVGVSSFFVEDGKPYCDDDWNELFTTKCVDCKGPIKVGQKWLEALGGQPFHADCFKCSTCKTILDGKIFFERQNRPYCRTHAIKAAIADSQKITK